MDHIVHRDRLGGRRASDEAGWDRGRKLLSVTKLSAGGALITSSLISLGAGIAGMSLSNHAEAAVAVAGGVATFIVLISALHIFDSHK